MDTVSVIAVVIVGAILLGLFFRILSLPLKLMMKLLLHAAVGFVSLFILNLLGSIVGISLEINALHCIIAGALGVPGVILMLIIKYVL